MLYNMIAFRHTKTFIFKRQIIGVANYEILYCPEQYRFATRPMLCRFNVQIDVNVTIGFVPTANI